MRAKLVNEGWWGMDIYGGDTPMDIVGGLIDSFEIDHDLYLDEPNHPSIIEKLEGNALTAERFMLDELSSWFRSGPNTDYVSIGYQVLGQFLMDAKVSIGDTLKQRIIEHAEKDEWANKAISTINSLERKRVIEEFVNKINQY